jgi:hypothetical protein
MNLIRVYYDDHDQPHLHAQYQDGKALLDFRGNILRGDLRSRTALRMVREWIDLHEAELVEDWELARAGKELKKIPPLE